MSGFQFGAPTTSGSLFAPTAAPCFRPPSFGTPTTSASISFGTPTSAPAFGSTNTSLAFGTPTSAQNPGLNFASASAAPSMFGKTCITPNPGLFGTPSTSAPSAPLFGTQTAAAPGTNLFGTPASSAPPSTLFGVGTTPTPTSSLFGTPTASTSASGLFSALTAPTQTSLAVGPTLPFGTATSATPRLGLLPTTSTTPTPIAPILGASFSSSNTPTPSFNFGISTSSTSANQTIPSTGLSFGLGASQGFNLSTRPTTQANIGLGGVAPTQQKLGTTTSGKTELIPKEQNLPNELQQTVQNFKEHVKKQKTFSSDIARCSIKEFRKVEGEIDLVTNLLNEVEKQLQNNRSVAEKLKHDTVKVLQNVEIAQRTFDTPPGLQYDNTSPLNFFIELADTFEKDMYGLKLQIDNTDKYIKNLGQQTPLNSQDLTNGMRKLHETFVALAGRLQSVHSEVETQKEQYLNLRKYMFHDDTNVFEKALPQNEILSVENINNLPSRIAAGPTPFNSFMNSSVVQQIQAQNPPPPYAATNQIGLKTTPTASFGVQPQTTTSLFGNTSNLGQSSSFLFNSSNTSTSFQLQRPPAGSKRKQ